MGAARWPIPLGGAAVLVGLFLLLRPTDEPGPQGTPPGSPAATPGSVATDLPPGQDALEAEIEIEEGRVEVAVEDRRLPSPATIEVAQGQWVSLRIEADVTDDVHVHGYDLPADLSPGERVTITFQATIPGVFEIETHGGGLVLARLEVSP